MTDYFTDNHRYLLIKLYVFRCLCLDVFLFTASVAVETDCGGNDRYAFAYYTEYRACEAVIYDSQGAGKQQALSEALRRTEPETESIYREAYHKQSRVPAVPEENAYEGDQTGKENREEQTREEFLISVVEENISYDTDYI